MPQRALVLLLIAGACAAADKTWVGGDGSWSDGAHWSPSGAPVDGDTAIFPATATTTTATNDLSGLRLASLRVAAPHWSLTGDTVTITTSLLVSGSGRALPVSLPIVVPGGQLRIDVAAGVSVAIDAALMGPGGVRKTGAGALALLAANSFDGPAEVVAGTVVLAVAGTLGSTAAGTAVDAGAMLVRDEISTAEPLTLSGLGSGRYGALTAENVDGPDVGSTCSGPITLIGLARVAATSGADATPTPLPTPDPAHLVLSGAIGGSGTLVVDDGSGHDNVVGLGGAAANTMSGGAIVHRGRLELAKTGGAVAIPHALVVGDTGDAEVHALLADQIADDAGVTVAAQGALVLDGDEVFDALTGAGAVILHDHLLEVGGHGGATTWSGVFANGELIADPAGAGTVTKVGGGAFTWLPATRAGKLGGGLVIEDGVATVDALEPDVPVQVLGHGVLTGTGRVGFLGAGMFSAGGGTIDPGRVGGVGTLACAGLDLVGTGRLVIDLAASGNDVLQVDGAVTLAGGSLAPVAHAAIATSRVIVRNDGVDAVSGAFPGWTGSAIDYAGGDGNDIAIAPTPTVTLSASAVRVGEGDGLVTLLVSLGGPIASASTVTWEADSGTAISGSDFSPSGGGLVFSPGGPTGQTISVPIIDDTAAEGDETFTIALTSTGGLALGSPSTCTVTIAANDGGVPPPPPPSGGGGGSGGGGCGAGAGIAAAALALSLRALAARR